MMETIYSWLPWTLCVLNGLASIPMWATCRWGSALYWTAACLITVGVNTIDRWG
jgi:hypothetical protein